MTPLFLAKLTNFPLIAKISPSNLTLRQIRATFAPKTRTMKTTDQIYRYTTKCSFSDEDWQSVLAYCREHFKGAKTHKARKPLAESTYGQFVEWVENGYGCGDFVGYGNTVGIVGDVLPGEVRLAVYLDSNRNVVSGDMLVLHPERLRTLGEAEISDFLKLVYASKKYFSVRNAKLVDACVPQKYLYYVLDNPVDNAPGVGMFIESDGTRHHFSAYLAKGKVTMDCWVDAGIAPLRPAVDSQIRALHHATSAMGLSFNGRLNEFVKTPRRGFDNVYWYLNDRFDLAMDRDNGSARHTARFKAGNYFADQAEGMLFMKEVKEMRGKTFKPSPSSK